MQDYREPKESILEALKKGPIVSDGAYVLTLEKRGYVLAGSWTPEMVLEHPEAVEELHREYLNVGADVVQAFTFGSCGKRLERGNIDTKVENINRAACEIAKKIAKANNAYLCGGISPTDLCKTAEPIDVEAVEDDIRTQIGPFIEHNVDYILVEFFFNILEIEVAIKVAKQYNKPVAATMRIGPPGDLNGVSSGECAVRMAKAGADIVGVNCSFDPKDSVETIRLMKKALDAEGLSPFLMMQPVGFHTQDVTHVKEGYHASNEFPFCLESRALTRFDVIEPTREAYELGVRYFGGCCGYEPQHIREIAYELRNEREKVAPGKKYHSAYGSGFTINTSMERYAKFSREYWMEVTKNTSTGRTKDS